jgi:RNA polymerase-interacting CarD/CdnL/TRCF family regulator
MIETRIFSIGDWVVHTQYGVGQIKAIEVKPVHGKQMECFQTRTRDSTFWFPTGEDVNPRIRPVYSKDLAHKAVEALRERPSNIEKDKEYFKEEISRVKTEGDLVAVCRLVRDLTAQGTLRRLLQTEATALSQLKEELLREWAVIMTCKVEEAELQLAACLRESKSRIPLQG